MLSNRFAGMACGEHFCLYFSVKLLISGCSISMFHIVFQISVHLRGAGKKAPVAVAWHFNVLQNAIDFTAEIKRLSDTAPVTVDPSGVRMCLLLFPSSTY